MSTHNISFSANILLNRPTFQSPDHSSHAGSSQRAVDGRYHTENADCSHTKYHWRAWWAVDMGQEYIIATVTLTNTRYYGK